MELTPCYARCEAGEPRTADNSLGPGRWAAEGLTREAVSKMVNIGNPASPLTPNQWEDRSKSYDLAKRVLGIK